MATTLGFCYIEKDTCGPLAVTGRVIAGVPRHKGEE
jgi:hypothetical protein